MNAKKNESLKRMLNPRHIAVVGGRMGVAVVKQLHKIGYEGQIWPVNPKRPDMAGVPCYKSIAELPDAPDAAFLAVPAEATVASVAELSAMGAGGAVCYASGFAEVGDTGKALQARLQAAIGDMAIVGPNCYGVLNYLDGVTLWPDEQGGRRIDKGVAIIAQSGNISISFSMQQRALPLAYLIATGNQAGMTVPEYIETLLEDDRVTAIGVHLEGLKDVVAFSHAALKALRKKVPLVVLKTGASDLGGQITMSHTSSLAGSDALYDTLFERVGVQRVHSIPELLESLKFLSIVGPVPDNSIASISCSGGEAAIVADRSAHFGLPMPPLHPAQHDALYESLGDRVALSNPLDYHTYIWGDEQAQYNAFSAMLMGRQSVTMKILDFPREDVCDPTDWVKTARAFADAVVASNRYGVVVATMQENMLASVGDMLIARNVAPMHGIDECMMAIKGAAHIYAKQQIADQIEPLAAPQSAETPPRTLDEQASKALLGQFGLPMPQSAEATSATAPAVAAELGFPVVVKVLSDSIVHKSDVGGVALNLRSEADVAQAVAGMAALGDRFLVETMAAKPLTELILGVTRDPQFGLALVVGAGGILVELVKDSQTLLFPVQRGDVEIALGRLKIAKILDGYRGQGAADKAAIVDAVMNLAAFAEAYAAELLELDINPLFVYREGEGVMAVDAVIRMAQ